MKGLLIALAIILLPVVSFADTTVFDYSSKIYVVSECISTISTSVTGTTAETTLFSCTMPGGIMGTNGTLFTLITASYTNSGNNKTYRIKFNTTTLSAPAVTTTAAFHEVFFVKNMNSYSVQEAGSNAANQFGTTSTVPISGAVDTSQAFTFSITCQLADAGDLCKLSKVVPFIIRK